MDQGNGLLPLTTRDVHADNSSSAEFEAPSANIAMLANVLAANASPIAERYSMDNDATMYHPPTNPQTERSKDMTSSGAEEDSESAARALLQLFSSGGD